MNGAAPSRAWNAVRDLYAAPWRRPSLYARISWQAAAGSGLAFVWSFIATIEVTAHEMSVFDATEGYLATTIVRAISLVFGFLAALAVLTTLVTVWLAAQHRIADRVGGGGNALCGVVLGGVGLAVYDFEAAFGQWITLAGVWLSAWGLVRALAEAAPRAPTLAWARGAAAPVIFGVTLLYLWEQVVRIGEISPVLLPAPSAIGARLLASPDILWGDFVQTFVKGALSGYAIGCGAAILTAIAIERADFLKRGLLPVGSFMAALPIVGIAPIMVMWFGADWQSKAAVVVVMVYFPVLVNAVAGLDAAGRAERELMRTYAATPAQGLLKLRLPAAWPFVFNGLKIASTLALIGAIVAEFFGSPIRGMGFRISTEVGRMNLDLVWATIAVAALAGSAFYGLIALAERRVAFWHPTVRSGG